MLNAFVITHDSILLQNSGTISDSQLKSYMKIDFLGKKSATDVFSKIVSCYDSQQIATYVPGTACVSEDHHLYGDPAYTLSGWQAASPAHTAISYTFSMYPCDDGMPDYNTGSTIPIGYGGSISEYTMTYGLDCARLRNNLQKAKNLIDHDTVKNKNNSMTANILTDTVEKGFYWGKDSSGKVKTSSIFTGTSTGLIMPISNSLFIPEAYTHTHLSVGYTNFSSKDINQFHTFYQGYNSINHNFAHASDGSVYVMTMEDQFAFDAFIQQYPDSIIDANNDWALGTSIRTDEDFLLKYFKNQGKSADEQMDLTLGYLIKKYNMGIMISKKGADGKFHPIQVDVITDPIFSTPLGYVQVNPCNL